MSSDAPDAPGSPSEPTREPATIVGGRPPGPSTHPNLPRRGALALTFAAILACGVLGGGIGYGLVNTSCPSRPTVAEQLLETVPRFHAHTPPCDLELVTAALVGTALTGIGAGVVAMLMLRAQSEWRAHPASRQPASGQPASRNRGARPPVRRPPAGGTPRRR